MKKNFYYVAFISLISSVMFSPLVLAQADSTASAKDELLLERYKWEVIKADSGSWLALVAPCSSTPKGALRGILTLMVNKRKAGDHRGRINFLFDKLVNDREGVNIRFYHDGKNDPVETMSLAITKNDKAKSSSAIIAERGYSTNISNGQQSDILQSLLRTDILVIEFSVKRTKMQSLVPVKWLRLQYQEL